MGADLASVCHVDEESGKSPPKKVMRSDLSLFISVLRLRHCDPGWPGGPLRRHCRLQVRGESDVYYLGHSESERTDDHLRARVIRL